MRQRLVRQPLRGFFGQHQRGAIGIATGNCGHHAGIDHPQAPHHASPSIAHTQLGVDYGLRIIDAAHARSAYRVEDGGGNVTRQTRKVVVALVLHARLPLRGLVFRQSRLGGDAARHAQRICRDFAVGVRAQVVGRNLWGI